MKIIRALLYLAAIEVFAALTGGYFGALHPALDSLSHFRLHLAVLLAVSGAGLALSGGVGGGLTSVAAGMLVLATTLGTPGFLHAEARLPGTQAPVYRLMHLNLRFDNKTPNEVIRLIGERSPDVLTLNEVSDAWAPRLGALKHLYPHQFYCESPDFVGGVAILSKRPFAPGAQTGCSNLGALATRMVDFGGRSVLVGALHLDWPWPFNQPWLLNDMAPQFTAIAAGQTPVLIAGDFNAVSWSHAVRRVAAETGTAHFEYRGGSWLFHTLPASWIGWLGLPIDNVLGDGIVAHSVAALRPVGSDHLPVLVEFSIAEAPEKPMETVLAK